MRVFVVFYLTCLILSVALFAALTPLSMTLAQEQDCLPALSNSDATLQSPSSSLVINEINISHNKAQLNCTRGSSTPIPSIDPWIELYNTSSNSLSLLKVVLDCGSNTNAFPLPASSIPAHGFVVVFPGTDAQFMQTFTSTLRLTLGDFVLDHIAFPAQLVQDTSYARIPDGSSSWKTTTNVTIGTSNAIVLATATAQTHKKSASKAKVKTSQKTSTKESISNQSTRQTQSSSSSQLPSSSTSPAATATAKVTQLQPDWKVVLLPTRIATSISSAQPATDLTTLISSSNPPDTLKKVIISLLIIALASTLWWCRKLFLKT